MLYSETLELIRAAVPSRAFRWGIYLVLWITIATVSTFYWREFPQGNYPYTFWGLYSAKLVLWFTWGLFAVAILAITNRWSIRRPVRFRRFLVLFAMSLLAVGIYVLFYALILVQAVGAELHLRIFRDLLRFTMTMHTTYFYLAFWALVSIEHAIIFYGDVHRSQLEKLRLESELTRARMESLTSQLHPHFLFNALNTVSSLILTSPREDAYNLVVELSEILRYSLELSQKPMIRFEEELKFAERYLHLLTARFPDTLNVTIEVTPECLPVAVPPLILHPLVENALKYSGTTSGKHGTVSLTGTSDNGTLLLAVSNSIQNGSASPPPGPGVGLGITRKRLESVYRRAAALEIDHSQNVFTVKLSLPAETGASTL